MLCECVVTRNFRAAGIRYTFYKCRRLQPALLKRHPEEIKISHRMGRGTTCQNQFRLMLGLQLQQVGKSS